MVKKNKLENRNLKCGQYISLDLFPSSERDIRKYVKRRKVSGGTRSDEGRQCRDTFASLKKTCKK